MVIRIDELSDVPIYLQIRNQIVMGISGGELAAGEQLPTVRALAMEIGINTMTVSKAYQLLKTEGYIMTDRKNGARIRTQIQKKGSIPEANKTELRRIVSEARISGVEKAENSGFASPKSVKATMLRLSVVAAPTVVRQTSILVMTIGEPTNGSVLKYSL